jgi:hypothetical protein
MEMKRIFAYLLVPLFDRVALDLLGGRALVVPALLDRGFRRHFY